MRFSMKGMLVAVAGVALGCAALLNANYHSALGATAVAALVLLAAIPLVVYRVGVARAFWVGFVGFGWGYVLLVMALGEWDVKVETPTRWLLYRLHELVATEHVDTQWQPPPAFLAARQVVLPPKILSPDLGHFVNVGRPVFLLVLACVGGLVGQSLYLSSEREKKESGP